MVFGFQPASPARKDSVLPGVASGLGLATDRGGLGAPPLQLVVSGSNSCFTLTLHVFVLFWVLLIISLVLVLILAIFVSVLVGLGH